MGRTEREEKRKRLTQVENLKRTSCERKTGRRKKRKRQTVRKTKEKKKWRRRKVRWKQRKKTVNLVISNTANTTKKMIKKSKTNCVRELNQIEQLIKCEMKTERKRHTREGQRNRKTAREKQR